MLNEFAFVAYPVLDLEKSRWFYGNVLGLKESENWENRWIEYEVGRSTLVITTFFPELIPGAAGAIVSIEVDSLDSVGTSLSAAGVEWHWGPREGSWCHSAMIKDPDGNRLLLHQKKKKPNQALDPTREARGSS